MSTRDFLREIEIFRDLTDAQRDKLAALAKAETHARGAEVFKERDAGSKLYAVMTGAIEIGRGRATGKFVRLALLERGEVFGELSLFEEAAHTVSAQAALAPEVHLVTWEHADLNRLMGEDIQLANVLLRSIGRKLANRIRTMSDAMSSLMRAFDKTAR